MQDRYVIATTGPTGYFPAFVPGDPGAGWTDDSRYARKFSHAADAIGWAASYGLDHPARSLVVWDLLTNSPVESDPAREG